MLPKHNEHYKNIGWFVSNIITQHGDEEEGRGRGRKKMPDAFSKFHFLPYGIYLPKLGSSRMIDILVFLGTSLELNRID